MKNGNARMTEMPAKNILIWLATLSNGKKLIIWCIDLAVFGSLIALLFIITKQPVFFSICIIHIAITGILFHMWGVVLTTLLFLIMDDIMRFFFLPGFNLSQVLPYNSLYILCIIIGSITNIIMRLLISLRQEVYKRRIAENKLEEENEWVRVVLISIRDGIITMDRNRKITFMNYEAERITGWNVEEAKNRDITSVYKIFNEKTGRLIKNPVERILKRGFVIGLANHTLLLTKAGVKIPIGDSGAPIKNKDGRLLGFVILFRDVSQKKEIQKKLDEANAQVIQSEKLAGIGQLAAGIAHEINNPLGYINSNLDTFEMYITNLKKIIAVYQDSKDEREISEAFTSLKIDYICKDIDSLLKDNKDGIRKISEIVKNLKDFARVNPSAEWESADLNVIISNVLLIIRNEIKYCAQTELNLSRDIPRIFCNVSEINQVFLNILINAVHAIKKKFGQGQGKISINTYLEKKHIACKITDNGCGIPRDIRARIFEPFFTTKEPGEGTGLGLHIVYDIIVKKHHGEIAVHSEEGKGTTFTLLFKIKQN